MMNQTITQPPHSTRTAHARRARALFHMLHRTTQLSHTPWQACAANTPSRPHATHMCRGAHVQAHRLRLHRHKPSTSTLSTSSSLPTWAPPRNNSQHISLVWLRATSPPMETAQPPAKYTNTHGRQVQASKCAASRTTFQTDQLRSTCKQASKQASRSQESTGCTPSQARHMRLGKTHQAEPRLENRL